MADARIITITVPVESSPATTHFNLRYNADGGSTWTDYNPGAGADISISTLSADNVYTLDGINSPTGNTAAASTTGNWYCLRLKSASGYGNWSDRFKIGDQRGYPEAGDIAGWLTAAGFTVSSAQSEFLSVIAEAARKSFERRCGRIFLGSGADTTRTYAPPTSRSGRLYIADVADLTSVTYQPTGQATATTWVLNTDFWTEPENNAADELPITALVLRQRWSEPLATCYRRCISVTGEHGFATRAAGLPEPVWVAMMKAGCLEEWAEFSQALTGGLLSWREADVQEDYGVEPLKRLKDGWTASVDRAVRLYQRMRM